MQAVEKVAPRLGVAAIAPAAVRWFAQPLGAPASLRRRKEIDGRRRSTGRGQESEMRGRALGLPSQASRRFSRQLSRGPLGPDQADISNDIPPGCRSVRLICTDLESPRRACFLPAVELHRNSRVSGL